MKKLWKICAIAMCMAMLFGCGSTNAGTQESTSQENDAAVENEAVAKAEEEARLIEEAHDNKEEAQTADKETDSEDKAASVEQTKADANDDKTKAEPEDAKDEQSKTEAKDAQNSNTTEDGLDDKVDRSKIKMFDEEKTMYLQSAANVRKGPSTSFDKVDYFEINTAVTVVGRYEEKGWYMIKHKDKNYAFISNSLLGDEEVDLDALKAQQEEAAMAAIRQAQANDQAAAQAQQAASAAAAAQAQVNDQAAVQAAAVAPVMAPAGILFIGDSRCVQMQEATAGGGCSWVCEGGKGYDWLTTKAMERAEPSIGKGTKVVICLGVNDTRNANNYAAFVNQKAAEWAARGARTYFVSVNPVSPNPWTSEEDVALFNSCVAPQLSGVIWIDTNSVLTANGYCMVDGMHFDYNTNVTVFNLIVGSLR